MKKLKLPKKPKIATSKLKTPEQVKAAKQKIAEYKKKVAEVKRHNQKLEADKHHVLKSRKTIQTELRGL